MSSRDRIILLTGDDNFDADSSGVNEITVRNTISITNKNSLSAGANTINSGTFNIDTSTDYQDLYVDLTATGLFFKMPSKNLLIQINQRNLNLDEKVLSGLTIYWDYVTLTEITTGITNTALSPSQFVDYSISGVMRYLYCIPDIYYINRISRITIASGITVPAEDLTLRFCQF